MPTAPYTSSRLAELAYTAHDEVRRLIERDGLSVALARLEQSTRALRCLTADLDEDRVEAVYALAQLARDAARRETRRDAQRRPQPTPDDDPDGGVAAGEAA